MTSKSWVTYSKGPLLRLRLRAGLPTVLLLGLFGACTQPAPDEAPSRDATELEAPEAEAPAMPLKAIMAGLASDMAGAAMGIWMEDPATIAEQAERIANHPRVPPEQMMAIQDALGTEFAEFAAFDGLVHDRAVALREGALAARPTSDLMGMFSDVAEGCVACHAAFRQRVSSTLAATAQEGSGLP